MLYQLGQHWHEGKSLHNPVYCAFCLPRAQRGTAVPQIVACHPSRAGREVSPVESGMEPGVAKATERYGFSLQECPTGLVDEETFKLIYSQFFPQGGKSTASPLPTTSKP